MAIRDRLTTGAFMYKVILHATDLTDTHFPISQRAAELAKSLGATLHLMHVIHPPTTMQIAQGLGFAEFDKPLTVEAEAVMQILGEALNVPQHCQIVEVGSIKYEILRHAKAIQCNLIIVGSHTPGELPAFLGSTAHAIVNHATCDVLTIQAE
jgi:nucleotide-binding universal stress UspA family protein